MRQCRMGFARGREGCRERIAGPDSATESGTEAVGPVHAIKEESIQRYIIMNILDPRRHGATIGILCAYGSPIDEWIILVIA